MNTDRILAEKTWKRMDGVVAVRCADAPSVLVSAMLSLKGFSATRL
jgi:hypothetical protein